MRRMAREFLAAEADAAGAAAHETHDRLQRRRLAGAVAPEERMDFSRPDLQRHALQHAHAAVSAIDAGDLQGHRPR